MIITKRDSDRIAGLVIESLIRFWRLQGHSLTGKFVRSLEYKVKEVVGVTVIDFYMENYGVILDRGVAASRVPYSPGSGARRSQYIEGLKEYAVRRMGVSRAEAERVAFAIASKHKREGIPTGASKRFSQTGKRTGFIEASVEEVEPMIREVIREATERYYEDEFKNEINGKG